MKRVFLAVDISGEARAKAADHARELRDGFSALRVVWERPEKMHLTLRFLGEIDETALAAVREAAKSVAATTPPFEIAMRGCGTFPGPTRPQVLWIGVDGEVEKIFGLKRSIDDRLEAFGIGREKRRYRPHLTIARIREPEKAAALGAAHIGQPFESDVFEVGSVSLYESLLDHRGSTYRALGAFELTGRR